MKTKRWSTWMAIALFASLGLLLASCAPISQPAPTQSGAPKAPAATEAKPAAPAPAKPAAPAATPVAPAAGQPKYGGSVTRFRENYPDMLDPHLSRGAAWWNDVLGPMYNGLLRLDDKMEIVPDLAEKWEQPSDLVYILRLRQGVKFHDNPTMKGREFTAEDAKFNIQRMATDDPKLMRRWQFQVVSNIEIPDKYTLKLTLKEPTAPFLDFLAQPYNYMVGKEAVEKFGDLSREEAGTGPFFLKSWTEKISYKVAKNPNYFTKGVPYLDEVNMIVVPDPATRVAGFRSGRADYILTSGNDFNALKRTNPKITAANLPASIIFLAFNPEAKPFTDQRVRQAFSLAIDRQAVIDIAMDGDGTITGPIYGVAASWRLPDDELKRLYKTDIPKAKELMADAGFPSGFPLDVIVSNRRPDAQDALIVVTQHLKQIGVDVKQRVLEHTTLISQRAAKDYVSMLHGGTAALEAGERITQYFMPKGQWNLDDPDITKFIDQQRVTVNKEKRQQVLNQFERLFIQKAYLVVLFGRGDYLVRQPHVKGPQEPSVLSQSLVAYAWIEK